MPVKEGDKEDNNDRENGKRKTEPSANLMTRSLSASAVHVVSYVVMKLIK